MFLGRHDEGPQKSLHGKFLPVGQSMGMDWLSRACVAGSFARREAPREPSFSRGEASLRRTAVLAAGDLFLLCRIEASGSVGSLNPDFSAVFRSPKYSSP